MTEIKYYCDRCGKEIDRMVDCISLHIELNHVDIETDLCVGCFQKLEETIKDFCSNG